MDKVSNAGFLLEIGREEVPSKYINREISYYKKYASRLLGTKEISVFATARRLIIYSPHPVDENLLNELDKRLFALVEEANLPKKMFWNSQKFRYARPIRWLLCFCNGKALPLDFGFIKSGNETCIINPKTKLKETFVVEDIRSFFDCLHSNGIIYDQEERAHVVRSKITELADSVQAEPLYDDELLWELVYSAERPTIFLGSFDERFLELPVEVLCSSMAANQRLIVLKDKASDKTKNFFIGQIDGEYSTDALEKIKDTVQYVLSSRLSDAMFFYKEDLKEPLSKRVPKLALVIMHEKIGSLADKVAVMEKVADECAQMLCLSAQDRDDLLEACRLAKTDLLTHIVNEFPELQGTMGRIYALKQGYNENIACALEEQYLPVNLQGDLPKTLLGSCLSVIDRVVTVCAYFGAGLFPTGSEDPYALKRQMLGAVKIVVSRPLPVLLDNLIKACFNHFGCTNGAEAYNRLYSFMEERVPAIFEWAGIRDKAVVAALWKRWGFDFAKAVEVGKQISDKTVREALQSAVKVNERAYRIIKGEQIDANAPIDEDLMEATEREFWANFQKIKGVFLEYIKKQQYKEAVETYSALLEPLHRFFADIMVNVDNAELRLNRLRILSSVYNLLDQHIGRFN